MTCFVKATPRQFTIENLSEDEYQEIIWSLENTCERGGARAKVAEQMVDELVHPDNL